MLTEKELKVIKESLSDDGKECLNHIGLALENYAIRKMCVKENFKDFKKEFLQIEKVCENFFECAKKIN